MLWPKLTNLFHMQPAIIGTTAEEGNSLVPYSTEGVDVALSDMVTKKYFLEPANEITR
jgi:hypothetical protein